jgi:hypothetical protein
MMEFSDFVSEQGLMDLPLVIINLMMILKVTSLLVDIRYKIDIESDIYNYSLLIMIYF